MTASIELAPGRELAPVPGLDELAATGPAECAELAGRIREFLIEHVSVHGGHLGANLGTVELTIALHRAFRSPETPIIWDTGHQAYTHKILTGRAAGFTSLRERQGMAGFPSREESAHDLLENSHASVGPAWAYGVSMATGRLSVVVLGDGALTGGVAYEALSAIGVRAAPVVVVINDNGRAYAPTPTRLTFGEPAIEPLPPENPAPRAFFESLGFRVHGPVDGHDIEALDAAFQQARQGPFPCVVHVRTQKGQGWHPAVSDTAKRLHDIGPRTSKTAGRSGAATWSSLAGDLLCEMAETDRRVHVITAAMPDTLGLVGFERRFPHRYHDMGIAEQASVAVAAGLASQGARPFFAVVTSFLTRALDQVLNDVALHDLSVVFLLDRAGVTGPDGPSHHGIYDVGMLRNVPGIEIYSPATAGDLQELFYGALHRKHGPVVIRYPKGSPLDEARLPAAPAQRAPLCLVAHGPTVAIAHHAAEMLTRQGMPCDVVRVKRVQPLESTLPAELSGRRLVMPVEEISASSSMANLLIAALQGLNPPLVTPITLPPGFLPHGPRDELLDEFGFTAVRIADTVAQEWSRVR